MTVSEFVGGKIRCERGMEKEVGRAIFSGGGSIGPPRGGPQKCPCLRKRVASLLATSTPRHFYYDDFFTDRRDYCACVVITAVCVIATICRR